MSGRSLNKVMLIGNLTRDPVMRYTPTNTAVCSFGIATNRSWTPADGGEKQEKADFHNIVAWSKLAEVCSQLLHKGDKVYVEGRLQTRDWKNKEGLDQRTTEVIIETMLLLNSRSSYPSSPAVAETEAVPAAKGKKSKKAVVQDDSAVTDEVAAVEDLADEVDIPF